MVWLAAKLAHLNLTHRHQDCKLCTVRCGSAVEALMPGCAAVIEAHPARRPDPPQYARTLPLPAPTAMPGCCACSPTPANTSGCTGGGCLPVLLRAASLTTGTQPGRCCLLVCTRETGSVTNRQPGDSYLHLGFLHVGIDNGRHVTESRFSSFAV